MCTAFLRNIALSALLCLYFNVQTAHAAVKIGAIGPGGGWIFFVDKDDQYPGFTYLEAAPTDIANVAWCNDTTYPIPAVSSWSSKAVGAGKANTIAMLGGCSSGAANAAHAYSTATTLPGDWFLPSQGELKWIYNNLQDLGVGGFANKYYWSSNEYGAKGAWFQDFGNGSQDYDLNKGLTLPVRAVRAF